MQPTPQGLPPTSHHRRHLPPAVSVDDPCGRGGLGLALLLGQCLLILLVWGLLIWFAPQSDRVRWWPVVTLIFLAAAGSLGRLAVQFRRVRQVQCNGAAWRLSIEGCERPLTGQATLVLDWQHTLCLRFDVESAPQGELSDRALGLTSRRRYWVWVSKQQAGDAWLALRRAAVATRQRGISNPDKRPSVIT